MKIKIHTTYDGIQKVEAKRLKFKRQGKLVFYIHRTWKASGRNQYSVVEKTSGMSLIQNASKNLCMAYIEGALKRYSKKKWKQVIIKGVRKNKIKYPLNK